MRWSVLAVVVACACGDNRVLETAPEAETLVPARVRVLTDAQYENVIRDLLGDVTVPEVRRPSTKPHQFLDDNVVAIDTALLSQYRVAAEALGREVEPLECATPVRERVAIDAACVRGKIDDFASRAFRRPLEAGELDELVAMFGQGGFGLVVEAVLQAPGFIYRSELGTAPAARVDLTSYELASALSFLLSDSIPDEPLWAAAKDQTITDPAVLSEHVDRLLATKRVQARIDGMVIDWLELDRIFAAPLIEPELRASMYAESTQFVHDVLWRRGGSLQELLASPASFADQRLGEHYELRGTYPEDTLVPTVHDPATRAGILTHANVLAMLSTSVRESIIRRGIYVHRRFLCTPELGRPPFSSIFEVVAFTSELTERQFGHYRLANAYCAGCHRVIDPPGRALMTYDGTGRSRTSDEVGAALESEATLTIDGRAVSVANGVELANALATSTQVARCVVDQFAHHAFGRVLDDAATRAFLYRRFDESGRDLVDVFRAIANSPAFRRRRGAP